MTITILKMTFKTTENAGDLVRSNKFPKTEIISLLQIKLTSVLFDCKSLTVS